jgi:RHS repeat-associated protein
MGINEYTIDYQYNDQGYRTNQTISYNNGSTWGTIKSIDYELVDDRVIYESGKEFDEDNLEINAYDIIYTYDYDGTLISFNYKDDTHASAEYFYLRNQQGDITHIINSSGTTIIKYKYDAYGNIIDEYVRPGYQHIFDHNSYTYRGYRYDSNTELYYLNSRYYNPEVGRFINADGLLGETGKILNTNMYTYGLNNPIMMTDDSGYMPKWLKKIGIVAIVAVVVVATVAATVSTAGLGTAIVAGAVYGTASAGGQMLSNYKHGEKNIMKNVAGAFVGGFISGATLGSPFGQVTAGFINATINEVENEWLYDNDPEAFNLEDVLYEGAIYSVANLFTGLLPKNTAQNLALFIDYVAFDFSDTHKDDLTSKFNRRAS